MTIINPTPHIRPVNSPREEGTAQKDQLYRLSLLASEVSRRFAAALADKSARSYALHGEDFDAAEHGDSAARLVAGVLAFISHELTNNSLADSCLDRDDPKQFRKGYVAALDQVRYELLEAVDRAL